MTYKTPHLDFEYFGVQGKMYKRIENVKVYHKTAFHARHFRIDFQKEKLHIYKENTDKAPKQTVDLIDLREVAI